MSAPLPRARVRALLLALTGLASTFLASMTASAQHAAPRERGSFGAWEPPFQHDLSGFAPPLAPFNAVHMSLVPTGPLRGRVLVWDLRGPQPTPEWNQRWSLLDVSTPTPAFLNAELTLPAGRGDLFCAGHAWTSAGKLFVAGGTSSYPDEARHGGTVGGRLVYLYDPGAGPAGSWERLHDLEFDRWYPTVLALDTGEILVAGGRPEATAEPYTHYEVYPPLRLDGSNHLRPVPPRVLPGPALPASEFGLYPRMHQLASGAQFVSGMGAASARMRHSLAPGVWTCMDSSSVGFRDYVCSLLYPVPHGGPELVMSIGGEAMDELGSLGVVDTVEVCAPGASGPPAWNWSRWPALNLPRARANAVILPDRSVLVVGGRANASGTPEEGVLYPELLDEERSGRRWRWMAPASSTRGYHSTALLLPDGRVLTGGGDKRRWDYQVFVPPYLLRARARPVLDAVPAVLEHADAHPGAYTLDFTLAPGEAVGHVALLAPGSVTHSFDASQRYVELALGAVTGASLEFHAPPDASHAPAGFYMLFLVSAAGVPSVAAWVELR